MPENVMPGTNVTGPSLTPDEWDLIVELLERERVSLLIEVRHTHARAMRERLTRRRESVDHMLDRLHALEAA